MIDWLLPIMYIVAVYTAYKLGYENGQREKGGKQI